MTINIEIKRADKCPETKYSMFLAFEYNSRAIEQVRSFPNKWWHADVKQWELPLRELGKLTQKLDWCEFDITGPYIEMETRVAKPIDGFEFKTKPFEHQMVGFQYGLENDRWLLADEQGLGKTKQVIDIAVAKKMQYGYEHCLIICGVNGLKWNWLNEIHTHSDEEGHILGQRYTRGKLTIGGNKDKLTDLCTLPNAYFLITNVESLRDKDIQDKVQELCKAGTIGVVAIDEIHKCFEYDTLITTDLGQLKIGDIVKDQISRFVLSYNEETGQQEWKRINDWFENTICEQLLELEIETSTGVKTIKCTAGHKFLTKNRGWVRADDLTSYDDIEEL